MIVLWRITERCNLGCPFCGYSRELKRTRRETPASEIRRFAMMLGEWRALSSRRILLSWLGGEPFLRHDLAALTEFSVRECGLEVSTTTNGTALGSGALRQHILDCYAELTVSVDGIGPVHDRLRAWPDGFVSLRGNVRRLALARIRDRRPLLRVNSVLMRGTIRGFPGLCRELAGWGIDEITFNQLGGIDRPGFYPSNRLTPADVAWLSGILPALRAELAEGGVALRGGENYLRRLAATVAGESLPVEDCGPGEQFLFIDEQDRVSPCALTSGEFGFPLSELRTAADLEALPHRFREVRRRRCAAACRDCHSTRVSAKFERATP
jgi:AdoMet-dependent heme synthase